MQVGERGSGREKYAPARKGGYQYGAKFSATNPEAPPLLTISVTPGLQYGTNQPRATISNSGNLAVGQDLTLSAGNLELQGQLSAERDLRLLAQDTVKVRDSAVNPFIASAGGQLLVQGDRTVDIFALNHPNSGLFSGADMVLRSANTVGGDAHYWSGGSFRIERLDGSLGGLLSPGDPVIRSSGDVFLASYQGASLHIFAGGSVTIPGYVWIQGADPSNGIVENVTLSDGTIVSINGRTQPTLDVRAGMNPAAIGVPGLTPVPPFGSTPVIPITTVIPTSADIRLGTIFFADAASSPIAGRVFLTNQYQPNPSLNGNIQVSATQGGFLTGIASRTGDFGSGGVVVYDSKASITINGVIQASAAPGFPPFLGNGGYVTLLANGDITFTPGTAIFSQGLWGGNITLKSKGAISLTNGGIASNSFTGVTGFTGGDINIVARSLSLSSAQLNSSTFGRANAGDVNINVSDAVTMTGVNGVTTAGIQSNVESGAIANGGNINIQAGSLSLSNGAQLQTLVRGASGLLSAGQGNAGSVNINVRDAVTIDGVNGGFFSAIASGLDFGTTGKGGDINIQAGSFSLTNGSQVTSSTFGRGDAGDVYINVRDAVTLNGANSLPLTLISSNVGVGAVGEGGNIDIHARSLSITNGAQVQASVQQGFGSFPAGQGNAGNLTVTASESVELVGTLANGQDSSGLFTQAEPGTTGNAGYLTINTRRLSVRDGAQLSATTLSTGKGGNLTVNASDSVEVVGKSANGQRSSRIISQTDFAGDAGDLRITTGRLSIRDGANVSTATIGAGKAGNLTVIADSVELTGTASGLTTGAAPRSTGDGGELNINTTEMLHHSQLPILPTHENQV